MSLRPLALALALSVMAGCLATEAAPPAGVAAHAGPSAPLYSETLAEHTPFTASDGVVLDTWTFRPVVPDGVRVPVILQDSPYFGNADPAIAERGQAFSRWLIDTFVPRGYAVVLKSVRGTGESGGCFGMGDLREAKDGYEVVEWLGAAEWSDGNVGMIGKSYRGTTPIMTAVLAPPSLKTIVPIGAITEWYLYVVSPGGVHYRDWVGFNTRFQQTYGFGSNRPTAESPGDAVAYAQKVCPTVAELTATEAHSTLTGEYNAGWQARDYAKDVAKMTASVYLVHGLQDFNVKPDQVAPWFHAVPTAKRALLGQWPHEYPYRTDWGDDLVRWFDHELKGVENGILREPLVKVEDSSGRWRHESEWPPTRATTLRLALGADGALVPGADAATGTLPLRADPTWTPDGAAGTNDRQLAAVTAPLDEETLVAGIPTLTFNASLDRPHALFAAVLYDVAPDGTWTAVNWAFLDTRHRDDLRSSAPMTPVVERDLMTLRFFPMDHRFEAGHAVGLALAGQHPRWVVSTSPAGVALVEAGPDAALHLPVVRGLVVEEPQPAVDDYERLPWYKA